MGKKAKEKEEKKSWRADSVICGTLCICQGLAVLSSVSIIYLSVIVYLPAKRELESGIGETPVMCTTVERRKKEHYSEACTSSSCTEWCLGKGSGPCDQIHVAVRENGTDVEFEGCSHVFRKECPILDSNTASEYNCKKNNQCTQLNGLFICQEGLCTNISEVFSCTWIKEEEEDPLNCYYKRNCVKLDGEYVCINGECSRVSGWSCRRKCEDIPMEDKNLLIMAGHSILTAHCRNGINSRNGEEIWEDSFEMENKMLAASCTVLEPALDSDLVRVTDCINGSLIPRNIFGSYSNLTSIYALYKENALRYRYDENKDIESKPRKQHLPFDFEITIYNKSVLHINHEGCVNTLQHECKSFYYNHGQDGRNQTSPSRFPCFYAAHDSEFVVTRYNVLKTKWIFLLFFTIPAIILIISCSTLFICSRVVGVTSYGAMAMVVKCCDKPRKDEIALNRLDNEDEEI